MILMYIRYSYEHQVYCGSNFNDARILPSRLRACTHPRAFPVSLRVFHAFCHSGEEASNFTLFCTTPPEPSPLRSPLVFTPRRLSWRALVASVGPGDPSTHASRELRFGPGEGRHAAARIPYVPRFGGSTFSQHCYVIEAVREGEEADGFPHGCRYVSFRHVSESIVSFVSSTSSVSSTATTVSSASVISVVSSLGTPPSSPGSCGCTCACCLCVRGRTHPHARSWRCAHLRFHRPCHRRGGPHVVAARIVSLSFQKHGRRDLSDAPRASSLRKCAPCHVSFGVRTNAEIPRTRGGRGTGEGDPRRVPGCMTRTPYASTSLGLSLIHI